MQKTISIAILLFGGLVSGLVACGGGGGGTGGGGGSGGGTGGGAPAKTGTCQSTCAKSIALDCTSGEHDQAACESSCEGQKAACSSQAADFQAYLDCIESTPMECGSATGAPSSPECVSQGLAILQCALNASDGGI